jgi:hypothetical protein
VSQANAEDESFSRTWLQNGDTSLDDAMESNAPTAAPLFHGISMTRASRTPSETPRPPRAQVSQRLACPKFQYNIMHGRQQSCHGANEANMSGICTHIRRAHKQFIQLCKTCNEHVIDRHDFETSHGVHCRNPRPQRRRNLKEEQWLSLFKKFFCEEMRSPSPCK